jgi:hypothetical protein
LGTHCVITQAFTWRPAQRGAALGLKQQFQQPCLFLRWRKVARFDRRCENGRVR